MIQGGGGLRVPRAPRLAAVERDDRALVDHQHHDVRIVRVPPQILIVVAARGALEGQECLSTIGRLVADDIGDDDRVGIFWVDVRDHLVDAADRTCVRRRAGPRLAGVVRSINPGPGAAGFDRCVHTTRVARRDGELGVDDAVWQPFGQLFPGRAAVDRFEQPTVGTVPRGVLPWALPLLPERREHDVRM